jgi:hypothetical protein
MTRIDDIKQALRKLAAIWPDDLWIFVGDGTLCLMRKNEKGERAIDGTGAVDQVYIIEEFSGIEADGGGW